MLLAYQVLITLAFLGMLLNAIDNVWRIRRDGRLGRAQPLPDPAPLISVCVPARNEARNIAACAESLARQDYPNFEVLILDDCSEDATGEIARQIAACYPNVRVLSGEPLPPGWIGKPHACQQLGQAARGEFLLFTDADTVFAPFALRRTLKLSLARRADLLSGLPAMEVKTLWERLSVPLLGLTGFGGISFRLIELSTIPFYGVASGAFLFFRRAAYEAIGGHYCVRDRIVEDIALARTTKRAMRRLVLTDVSSLVSCRMYTTLREVWEGFGKNVYSVFPGALFPFALAALPCLYIGPWFSFIFGPALGWGLWGGTLLPLVQLVILALLKAAVDLRTGRSGVGEILLVPFSALFLMIIALRSGSRALLRQSTPWRARHYDLWKS